VNVPEEQDSDDVLGVYPDKHCVVHVEPEFIEDPSLQDPPLASLETVGAEQDVDAEEEVVSCRRARRINVRPVKAFSSPPLLRRSTTIPLSVWPMLWP
jgi:hypothetical protein